MMNAQPVQFKFNDYLSNAFELLKKDFGSILGAFLLTIIMSIIPFCGYLAMGNFYKFLHKKARGEQATPGDIFNFDDFMPYFKLQLIVIGGILLLYLPFIMYFASTDWSPGEQQQVVFPVFLYIYSIAAYFAIFWVVLKAFYMPGIISLKGIKDLKSAWKLSSALSKGNLLMIFLFSIVTSIIGMLGVIACGIGIFLTLPFVYVAYYFAFEDAFAQNNETAASSPEILTT